MLVNLLNFVTFTASVVSSFIHYNDRFIGDVARQYPTVLTPASFAFGIWLLIYASVGLFVLWQVIQPDKAQPATRAIGPWLIIASICQAIWVPLWNHEQLALSAIFMCGIFISLLILNTRLEERFPLDPLEVKRQRTNVGRRTILLPFVQSLELQNFLIHFPFSMWFGWVTVALATNWTVVLTYPSDHGPRSEFFSSTLWAWLSFFTLFSAARIWSSLTGDFVYGLTLAWGAIGIALRDPKLSFMGAQNIEMVAALVATALIAFSLWDAYVVYGRPKLPKAFPLKPETKPAVPATQPDTTAVPIIQPETIPETQT